MEPLLGWSAPLSGDLMLTQVFLLPCERWSIEYKVLRPQTNLMWLISKLSEEKDGPTQGLQ